ncbi:MULTISPECIES: glycosyltransferase family 2 protein [Pasteurellaceae]|uniref:Glycosyltransferase family A protein n=1 Tax=Pasteurella atlantica TaxID=2827233 RepID=A0AAW8CS11_9PAST|nr:glycosyltransferase family A protein [Pasteurella atlantica]MBR0574266.1 glycosyltransferase family 2 protein [Pasteurella atlantica]MDP8040170.1 glycosyltransferase family A protein [Pasteurella atlantica]MDP8042307.1 glycosyltransferase family A protein [Pasteurella atlantica]MDP8044476.1 glycosyltransferase family A protein [Pasteurella atlantica]MDP8046512.1 glycosyltransferase family A protein [Pasteurella atlantica]
MKNKTQQKFNVAVISATVGRTSLHKCIQSVQQQSYPVTHYIYIDGPEYVQASREILKNYPNVNVIVMENNTGAGGYHNSYINARACNEIEADIFCFLDDDNFYDSNHIETIVNAFKEEPNTDIAYVNRRFVDKFNTYICDDNSYSLGIFEQQNEVTLPIKYKGYQQTIKAIINKPFMKLVDTNCMAMSKSYAKRHGSDWSDKGNDMYVWQQALARKANLFGTGQCTVNYFIELQSTYGKDFFPRLGKLLGMEIVTEQDIFELEKVFLIAVNNTVPKMIGHSLWQTKVKVGYLT